MGEQEKAGAWIIFMAAAIAANADNEQKTEEAAKDSAAMADAALKEYVARFPRGRLQ